MLMPQFIRKFRRDFLRDRIIANGKRLQQLRVARAGINEAVWPHDAAAFDQMIDNLERRHRRLLAKFKEA